jgi:hypothetical protein
VAVTWVLGLGVGAEAGGGRGCGASYDDNSLAGKGAYVQAVLDGSSI